MERCHIIHAIPQLLEFPINLSVGTSCVDMVCSVV